MSVFRDTVAERFRELRATEQYRLRAKFDFEEIAAVPAALLPVIADEMTRMIGDRSVAGKSTAFKARRDYSAGQFKTVWPG